MGMYAELIAIGPFSAAIVDHLEYSADRYIETKEGSIINQTLFGITEGNALSKTLATILGISDAWDFNQHKVDVDSIDFAKLIEFGETYSDYAGDVKTLQILSNNGFEFHFSPNG